MKLLLMADHAVGFAITRWLLAKFREDVEFVVAMSENDICDMAKDVGVPYVVFESSEQICDLIGRLNLTFDLGVLAWWPRIVRPPLLTKPRFGFINTHPSLLPYNRGKHYNFWALVEQAPFGVSLHMVEEGVDCGDVIAQAPILYGWEDTGETLYRKATLAMVQLFQDNYPCLRALRFSGQKQDLTHGSFHRAAELEPASRIELDRTYRARDLLNVLRARTFPGHPSCYFSDNGDIFEVRIDIRRKPL